MTSSYLTIISTTCIPTISQGKEFFIMTSKLGSASHLYRRAGAVCLTIGSAVLLLAACHSYGKTYTWANRLPSADCNPRTAKARAELGGCPKLTDPQHPTLQEVHVFVNYMNKKDAIEGTEIDGRIEPPGCNKWSIDPASGQLKFASTRNSERCQGKSLEKSIRTFKIPSGG
jgi:hypothetical protein